MSGLLNRRSMIGALASLTVAIRVPSVGAQTWAPYAAPAPPAVTARSIYVYDATSGTPLLALNPDESLPPASLTKIVSALVVLENANLDDFVTILAEDLVDEDQSRVGFVEGDTLTVRDLLAGLLIPSGNDAANALARYVGTNLQGGSGGDPVETFVGAMNGVVERLGLTTTRFVNPHGLDAEGHLASARDLALLTARAMQDPIFAEIVSTSTMVLPSSLNPEGYEIFTTNDLLVDGTAIGVKTGTTELGGGCLVTATTAGSNLVISVVLGSELITDEFGYPKSPARFSDTRELLATIEEDYLWVDPETVPGLPEELAAWSATLPAGATVPVPSGRMDEFGYRLVLGPPAESGAPVGRVLLIVGGEVLSERQVLQAV